jgi:hypothetical protein
MWQWYCSNIITLLHYHCQQQWGAWLFSFLKSSIEVVNLAARSLLCYSTVSIKTKCKDQHKLHRLHLPLGC